MKQRRRAVLWAMGLLLLGLLCYQIGLRQVWDHVRTLGWGFLPVLGISCLWQISNTCAWAVCFSQEDGGGPRRRPGFWALLRMKLSGEALGNVAPASHLGGELAKAYMLRGSVALTLGLPSLVINKTMEIISGLAFVLLGVGLAFRRLPLPMEVRNAMVAFLVLATLVTAVATLKQQSNTFTWILDLLKRLRLRFLEARRDQVAEMDRNIAAFYRRDRRGFLTSLGLHALSWVFGVAEVFYILSVLGQPLPLVSAFLFCSLSLIINTVFFFIPSGVGVFEGGHVFLFHLLGLGTGLGLAVGIIRRIRRVFWVLVGVFLLLPGAAADGSRSGREEGLQRGEVQDTRDESA